MTRAHRITTIYDAGGTHALEVARERAPAPGLHMRLNNRFCPRCCADVDPAGGINTAIGFLCFNHRRYAPTKAPA